MKRCLIAVIAVISALCCGKLRAAPEAKRAASHSAKAVKRAEKAAAAERRRARKSAADHDHHHHYYYWYDDDYWDRDGVRNAACVLKVRKVLSDSSGLFEVKSCTGEIAFASDAPKTGIDRFLNEKQLIRIDGIDMYKRHTGDLLFLPESRNLRFCGEYRDPHGKVFLCFTLDEKNGAVFTK